MSMAMTQQDLLDHYEQEWKTKSDAAGDDSGLRYSSPVDATVLDPIYERLLHDLGNRVDDGRILAVASSS